MLYQAKTYAEEKTQGSQINMFYASVTKITALCCVKIKSKELLGYIHEWKLRTHHDKIFFGDSTVTFSQKKYNGH